MPTTLPAALRDRGDVALRAVRVAADVAGDDPALGLELVEGALVGDEAALAVLDRDQDLLALVKRVGPGRRGRLDPQELVAVAEVQVLVAGERAGQQVGLAEDLEAVADAEHRQAAAGGVGDRLHDRGEPGDGAAAQVVAVGEAAGQDDGVDAVQVGVGVPEADGVGRRRAATARAASPSSSEPGKVTTPIRMVTRSIDRCAGPASSTRIVKSSITGLASSLSAISRAWSRSAHRRTRSRSAGRCGRRRRRSTPSRGSALATAWPCGSRISGLSMTSTTTRATGTPDCGAQLGAPVAGERPSLPGRLPIRPIGSCRQPGAPPTATIVIRTADRAHTDSARDRRDHGETAQTAAPT